MSVSSRSFPTKAQRREVRKLGARQLEKPLIAVLKCVNVARCADTDAFGVDVMQRAALGRSKVALLWPLQASHWQEDHEVAGGMPGPCPGPCSVLACARTVRGSCSCARRIGCSCLGLFPGAGWHFDCLFIANRVCIGEGCKWVGGLIGNGDALVACQIPREKHDCSAPWRAERGEWR